jgi:hypothetical protein
MDVKQMPTSASRRVWEGKAFDYSVEMAEQAIVDALLRCCCPLRRRALRPARNARVKNPEKIRLNRELTLAMA